MVIQSKNGKSRYFFPSHMFTFHSLVQLLLPTFVHPVGDSYFYFMLCQSYLLSTVISFVYKDKLWLDKSMSVIFCMENT